MAEGREHAVGGLLPPACERYRVRVRADLRSAQYGLLNVPKYGSVGTAFQVVRTPAIARAVAKYDVAEPTIGGLVQPNEH